MNSPKISVIIPAYNCAKYVGEAVESVLAQSYQAYEIIVVDDGSLDNTKEIIDGFQKKYKAVLYYFQNNSGSSVARNFGLMKSRGEFVAFLDADDIWLSDKLQTQMACFANNPQLDAIFTNGEVFSQEGGAKGSYVKPPYTICSLENIFEKLLLKNFIPLSSLLIKQNLLKTIGVFDSAIRGSEDYDFVLRLAKSSKICFLNKSLFRYRMSSTNKSSNQELRHRMTIQILEKHIKISNLPMTAILRQRFANCYYGLGYALYEKNKFAESRKAFVRSMLYWPWNNLKKYPLCILTLR